MPARSIASWASRVVGRPCRIPVPTTVREPAAPMNGEGDPDRLLHPEVDLGRRRFLIALGLDLREIGLLLTSLVLEEGPVVVTQMPGSSRVLIDRVFSVLPLFVPLRPSLRLLRAFGQFVQEI